MASGTTVRRVLLQLQADDGDTEAKLDAISAKADELAQKHPELAVRIQTAAASAKLRAIRDDLKATADSAAANPIVPEVADGPSALKIDELKRKLDELSAKAAGVKVKVDDTAADVKLLSLKARLAELSDKVAHPHIRVSGVARAEADIAAVSLELDKLNGKGGGFLSRLGGLLGPGSSLTSGVPLVGAGGPVAVGAGLTALQFALPEVAALASGLTAAGLGVGGFAALAMPAFDKVHNAYTKINTDQAAYNNALTSAQRKTAMEHLKQDWASLNPAETGALKGVQQLAGEFAKMSKAFEPTAFKVFDQVLQIANQLMPYVGQFATAAAPAIEGVLGMFSKFFQGSTFRDFMKFMESLAGPAIKAFGSGMVGLLPPLMHLMELFSKKDVVEAINIAFRGLGFAIDLVVYAIEYSMKEWDWLTAELHVIAHDFDVTRHAIASFAHGVAHDFDDVRHDAATLAHDVAHYFDDVRHAAATLGHDIAAHFDEIRHDIAHWVGDVRHDVASVADWFARLPGAVVRGTSIMVQDLFKLGVNAMSALWRGLGSMVGGLISTAGGWAHDIANALGAPFGIHFSEPSEATQMIKAGRRVAEGLDLGITQGLGSSAALARLSRLTAGGHGVAVAGAGGGTARLQLEWVGGQADQALITLLKNHIRVRGGDPGVLGR